MKRLKFYLFTLLLLGSISLESCGPVIISSRPSHQIPSWFYPNRVVNVRYVYFPDYTIYYDLTLRNYLYYENNVWIRVNVLPSRFKGIILMIILECIILIGVLMKQADELQQLAEVEDDNEIL